MIDIDPLSENETSAIVEVINEAATAYRGIIPPEHDTEPYMSLSKLEEEMEEIDFYGAHVEGRLVGVIGLQDCGDAFLVRHLYVLSDFQQQGIGTRLVDFAVEQADVADVYVGTWAAADWALDFYERYGFENLGSARDLLDQYWGVPASQADASVVLHYRK